MRSDEALQACNKAQLTAVVQDCTLHGIPVRALVVHNANWNGNGTMVIIDKADTIPDETVYRVILEMAQSEQSYFA